MKYSYISHEGPFRNNIMPGKDIERIIRDKNKFIITRINSNFHVLVYRNGILEKEKLVFSFFELVNFLKKNWFTAYFINVNSETVYHISIYLKKDETIKETDTISPKRFFTIQGDSMLKLEAYINRNTLKGKLLQVYDEDTIDDSKSQTIGLFDFIENKELFELYQLPFSEKGGKFVVPNYSYAHPSLFYILSSIYKGKDEKINLSSNDIANLYYASILNEDIVKDILKNIEIRILKMYNLDDFSKSIDFIDLYSKQENDSYIKLKKMKARLEEAINNKKIVDALGLLEIAEKGKEFAKERNS